MFLLKEGKKVYLSLLGEFLSIPIRTFDFPCLAQ